MAILKHESRETTQRTKYTRDNGGLRLRGGAIVLLGYSNQYNRLWLIESRELVKQERNNNFRNSVMAHDVVCGAPNPNPQKIQMGLDDLLLIECSFIGTPKDLAGSRDERNPEINDHGGGYPLPVPRPYGPALGIMRKTLALHCLTTSMDHSSK
jgi:hypothetical protein